MKGEPPPGPAGSRTGHPAPVIDAQRVGPGAASVTGGFTFTVIEAPPEPSDRRRAPRQRTRLRSGKIVDLKGRFLTECLWHDLSRRGGRLRVPTGCVLPDAIQVYDDQTGELYRASVLWQREREAGVALRPAADDDRSRMVAAELRRKYYAVRD